MRPTRFEHLQLPIRCAAMTLLMATAAPVRAAIELGYCGYIGGSSGDHARSLAIDAAGDAYLAGTSDSNEITFPVSVGPDLTQNGPSDAFVAKLRLDGTGLVFAGYVGGSGWESGSLSLGLALDLGANAYLCGETDSTEATFPVRIGPDLSFNLTSDIFVAKVLASGTDLGYAGFIGGNGPDRGFDCAVDRAGAAYLTGDTWSDAGTFPATVGPDLSANLKDAFVAKVAPDGASLVYAGYIGGSESLELGIGIAVDDSGNAYVDGYGLSTEASFPVKIGPDLSQNGGSDGFVAKVVPDGSGLEYAGFIGGSGPNDAIFALALDVTGHALTAGETDSSETTFPVAIGPDLSFAGGLVDGFATKVRPDGSGLVWAGYLGGSKADMVLGIAVDTTGAVAVAGSTSSTETSFPVLGGPDLTANGDYDGFVSTIAADGSSLIWSGFLGGSGFDQAQGIVFAAAGQVLVAGDTFSDETSFPVRIGPDLSYNDDMDAFVASVEESACATAPGAIVGLQAVRDPGSRDDVAMTWQLDGGANGYNIWYVDHKEDIPLATQRTQPPATPVTGCADPSPSLGTRCSDSGGVSRATPALFCYQVRAFCSLASEGP